MPQVPYTPYPTVAPIGAGDNYQRINASPDAFGAQVGGALAQLGDVVTRNALRMTALRDEADAKDAYVSAAVKLGKIETDFYSLEGKNAVDAYPAFVQSVEALRKESIDALSSNGAKKMFDSDFTRNAVFTINSASRHSATENKNYIGGQSDARVKLALQDSASRFSDEVAFSENLGVINHEMDLQGSIHGWSPEEVEAKKAAARSGAWSNRITEMALYEPFEAAALLRSHQGEMTPENVKTVEEFVRNAERTTGSRKVADDILSGKMVRKTLVDSVADVHGVVSPEVGRAAAEAVGVPFDEAKLKDPAYARQLATVYMNNLLERYNGNEALAVAAFVTSPAMVSEWENKFGTPGVNTPIEDWLKKVDPAVGETLRRAGAPSGKQDLATLIAQAKEAAATYAPDDPAFEDNLVSRVSAEFELRQRIAKDAEDASFETVQTWGLGDPGPGGPTSMGDAPPEVLRKYLALPTDRQKSIDSLLRTNAAGTKNSTMTPAALAKYHELLGIASNDPAKFKSIDITAETVLPPSLMKQLIDKQTAVRAGKSQDISLARAKEIAAPLLKAASIDNGTEDYNTFVGAFSEALSAFTAEKKHKPSDDETLKIASDLLRKVVTNDRSTFFPFHGFGVYTGNSRDETPAYKLPAGSRPPSSNDQTFEPVQAPLTSTAVPPGDRTAIISSYTRRFGSPPTEGQIAQFYLAGKKIK